MSLLCGNKNCKLWIYVGYIRVDPSPDVVKIVIFDEAPPREFHEAADLGKKNCLPINEIQREL